MNIVVLTRRNFLRYLNARFQKFQNEQVSITTKDDENLRLDDYNTPKQKIDRIRELYGSDAFLILHDGDIFARGHSSGKYVDSIYTFHHDEDDIVYRHLFLDEYDSLEKLINALQEMS